MTRTARLRALAKINLHLRVIARRPDGFHELRTVFHTISLADRIGVTFTPARRTTIEIEGAQIAGNLVAKAAEAVLDAIGRKAHVAFRLEKHIPMGAGLGGGSSDAAAVLLALPVLAGRRVKPETLLDLASALGSDVPFFLHGGAAAAIGRGTELFPLPDLPSAHGVLIAPDLPVSTPEAYRALSPRLTSHAVQNKIVSFQSALWGGVCSGGWNDFEEVVFERHPRLASLKRRLLKLGAAHALMSGSGSSLFGLFRTRADATHALRSFGEERVFPISLISRARYRRQWWRQLAPHVESEIWPPLSRYASPTHRKP